MQVPVAVLSLFTAEELELSVCARATVDVDVLRECTEYGDGCAPPLPAPRAGRANACSCVARVCVFVAGCVAVCWWRGVCVAWLYVGGAGCVWLGCMLVARGVCGLGVCWWRGVCVAWVCVGGAVCVAVCWWRGQDGVSERACVYAQAERGAPARAELLGGRV